MAQSIVLKRSAISGKVPDTGSLSLGEIAVNTYDGRVFFKKSGSTESVEHIVTTNSITTGSITLTQTGSFGEIIVTQDANFQRDIFVTRDIVGNGDLDILGSFTASLSNGYVWVGNASNKTSLVATSSFGGALSGDVNLLISKTGSYATTGSNTFNGNQVISGSITITQNLIVLGSSSIQNISSSTLNIGTNIITVAVDTPSVRFGGLSVIDSGSTVGSGSFLYDSVEDEFIFVHRGDGTNITSSHFILGPETYNNLGNETYLTLNRLPKGTGIEHLVDSNITDTGNIVSINSNTQITGSLTISGSNPIIVSMIDNPFGDIIIEAKSGSINTGSVELHGGLKWKRTATATPTEIGDLITFGGTMGLIEGGTLTTASVGGLVAQAGESVMYTMNTFPYGTHNLVKFDTIGSSDASRQITLPQTSSVYVYYNNSGVLTYAATAPSTRSNIILGKVTTDTSKIVYIDAAQINAHHYGNYIDRLFREGLGPIFSSGGLVSQGTTSGSLNVTAATYFFSQNRITTNARTGISMDSFYRSSVAGQYVRTTGVTKVDSGSYDNGSGTLVSVPAGKYVKHSLYMLGDNSLQSTATEAYMLVYGQTLFDTSGEAQAGSLPSPPSYFTDSIVILASIVVTPDSSSIQSIIDERPRLGFISPSKTGILTAHADLSGLTNDDHPQYLLTDGSRTLTGNINLGTNNITNVGTLTATTINGSINATNGVVSGSSQIVSILNPLNSFTSSTDTKFTTLSNITSSLNTFTSSANSRLNNLESFTSSLDSTFVNNTELGTATGSLINSIATKLNTSSFETYTSSIDTKFTTLSNVTASLNASTASQQTSIDLIGQFTSSQNTKNTTLSTYTSSIDTKFTTLQNVTASLINATSSYETNGRGIVSGSSQITPLLPTGTVSGSSQVIGILSSLNSYTASNDTTNTTQNSRLSSLESFTSSLDVTFVNQTELANATGSLINSIATKLNTSSFETYTGSIDTKFTTLSNTTASLNASTASQQNSIDLLGTFTSSQNTKNSTLATYTSSIDTKFASLATYTGSIDTKFTTLQNVTSSLISKTGSYATTGSNTFYGTQTIEGNILPNTANTHSLGSLSNYWNEIYLHSTSSIKFIENGVIQSVISSTNDGGVQIGNVVITTSSIIFVDDNGNITETVAQSSSVGSTSTFTTTSSFNEYTASANNRLNSLENFTASIDNTFVNNTELANATGSLINSIATKLNTSSFETYTGSIETKNSTLASYTGSVDTKFTTLANVTSSLNQFTSSANGRLNSLESFTASLDATYVNQTELASATASLINSIATKLNTSSFETYTGSIDTKFTSLQNSTSSLNASTASQQNSIDLLGAFTSSQNTKNTTLSTYTSSIDTKFATLATTTASLLVETSNLELFSASTLTRLTNIELFSSSENSKNTTLATYTGSVDTKFTTLAATTASLLVETANLELFSASTLTRLSNIELFSASENSKNTTLATYTSSIDTKFSTLQTTTASIQNSITLINTFTSSVDTKFTTLANVTSSLISKTGSYATTGSNSFYGNQSISGSIYVTGSSYFYKTASDYVYLLDEANTITFAAGAPSYIKYGNATILAMKSGGGNSTILHGAGAAILSATQFGVKIQQSADGAYANSMLYVKGSGSAATSTAVKVENSSGNPSITIFDNNTIAINKTSANGTLDISGSVIITGSLDINNAEFNATASNSTAGNVIVSTNPTASYNSAFYNYSITSGSNARAGQIMSIWNGNTLRYTEVTTTDIGNTSTAVFSASISAGNVLLHLSSSGVWNVRLIVNLL